MIGLSELKTKVELEIVPEFEQQIFQSKTIEQCEEATIYIIRKIA